LRRRSWLTLAAIGAAIIAISVGAALFQPRPIVTGNNTNGNTTIAAENTTAKTTLNVISTASAFPFVQRWAAQYNNDQAAVTLQVSYVEGAEMAGDMAIVGSAGDSNRSYVPVSAQALAIVYNVPGFPDLPSGLKLDAGVLSRILNGSIARWNDPAIANLNQDMNLPNERISVVYDASDSSSSVLLGHYLSSGAKWPKGSIATSSPDELASLVRKTPYSIGYVDFSYAIQTRMTFAAIANPHSEYVLPSTDSIWRAVNSSMQVQNITTVNQTAGLTPPFINASALGNGSYPLTGLYYASLPSNVPNPTKNETLDLVRWMIDDGQQTLSEVQYPSIYQDNKPLITYSGSIINNTLTRVSKS
jgi:phosphate transport system substrate-binding protein